MTHIGENTVAEEHWLPKYQDKARQLVKQQLKQGLSIPELLEKIANAEPTKQARAFRFAISQELSDKRIAPRYQDLDYYLDTEEQFRQWKEDRCLIDLYWLSVEYPKHITPNSAWQPLFSDGFSPALAMRITKRQITNAKRVRMLMLSDFQQYGCLHLISRKAKERLKALQKGQAREYSRQMKRAAKTPQIGTSEATGRALVWLCAELSTAGGSKRSPQRTADLYCQMTGNRLSRQAMADRMKKITAQRKKPVISFP